jgi:hypothetical protein
MYFFFYNFNSSKLCITAIFEFLQQNLSYNDIVQSLQVLNLIADVTKAVLSENIDLTWDRLAKLKKFFPVKIPFYYTLIKI